MTLSPNIVAFGIIVAGGLALFAGGSSMDRAATADARLPAAHPATPAWSAALNQQIAADAAAAGPHAPPATAAAAGITLHSVGFDLPTSDRSFPPGPGVELMTGCTACHSAGMILNQPHLTQAEWNGEVTKMLHVYKAPVPDADVPGIVAYLAALKTAS